MRSTDGFMRRRRGPHPQLQRRNLDGALPLQRSAEVGKNISPLRPNASNSDAAQPLNAATSLDKQLDIEDILRPEQTQKPAKQRRFSIFGRRKNKVKPRASRKKIILRVLIPLLVIILGVGGFMAWKLLNTTGKVFQGNALSAVFGGNKPLKTDQYGRSNILLFGTSEDDPGHPGGDLTDSIMVLSIDQKKHDAFIFSVPRDLWVKFGKACLSGYEGKINEVYLCGKTGADENAGQVALRDRVGEVFGIDLQYTLHVNYGVLRSSIDALGGVDITIESPDPRGILDRNFDWRCKYKCYLVKWPNGPAHLDGEHALYLAQARNDTGGYGLPRSNFDREANQRKILIAAKEKATSIGFLANPVAVTKLLDSLGKNVRTNIDANEIKTFIDVAKNTDSKNITSISLIDQDPAVLTTGAGPNGSSVVKPAAGLYSYEALKTFIQANLSGNGALLKEKAVVDVLNASGTPGIAQKQADDLANAGITVGVISNAPTGDYGKAKLYDLSKGTKPATKKKLEEKLGVSTTTEPLPASIHSTAAFVVVIGQAPSASGSAN